MKQTYLSFTIGFFLLSGNKLNAQTIWTGPDYTFSNDPSADWTLPSNQDIITPEIVLTRQDFKMIYNYQWFQTNFNEDASETDLSFNFWNNSNVGTPTHSFNPTGGPKGIKWAILDSTGASTSWSGYSFYGTLGDSSNFYSLHNVLSMIRELELGNAVTSVDDDFFINGDSSGTGSSVNNVTNIIGKKLGVWIVSDDIYFTITFNSWAAGNNGGAFSYTRSTDQISSTKEFESNNFVKLYPNPANDYIQIVGLTANQKYTIYNTLGKEIKRGVVSNNDRIDIESSINGLHFLKFENGHVIKFLKE